MVRLSIKGIGGGPDTCHLSTCGFIAGGFTEKGNYVMTSIRQEVELKYGLAGRSDYEKLCRKMDPPLEDNEQVNHYFQSPDGRIPGDKGVVRIRLEKGEVLFTVKLGGSLTEGVASSREYEEPWKGPVEDPPLLSESIWESGYAGMDALAQTFGPGFSLVWAGKMINRRKIYPVAANLLLEVDASRYPDGYVDYEVELETMNPDQDRFLLLSLLDELDVGYGPQTETKYQRFLRHI